MATIRLKMSHSYTLAKTVAILSLLTPGSGYSLGIGGIKLHSELNQNLDADISLVLSTGDKAADIKVNLAPPDKFDQAGIPWTSFLSKIKFSTIVEANGSVIIKLNSKEVVKEPFLNFLLQVTWSKGSLYREFTVLLDPPAAYKRTTHLTQDNPENEQSEPFDRSRDKPDISGTRSYGPTNKNDTLSNIAEKIGRQIDISIEKMIIALYEENPSAFYQGNMNALMTGKILKIPEREIILKYSQKQALAEFNRQKKSWKDRLETASSATLPTTKIVTPEKQLTLTIPTEENSTETENSVPKNEPVIAKKQIDNTASKAQDKVSSPINDTLQSKVTELEKQLTIMQQILALKDQQLATLQNQLQEKPLVKTTPEQATIINPASERSVVQSTTAKPTIEPKNKVTLSSNTYYLWSGIGTGILSLLGWFWWKKYKFNSRNTYNSIDINEMSEFNPNFSTTTTEESKHPFFSEIIFSNLDTSDNYQGEIDPVSETDVYLAYGRYQQAEELMREVIKDQPNRDDYKLKLLKIFYLNKNKYAFETYANELAKAGKKSDIEFWKKIVEMGNELCKGSILFTAKTDEVSQHEKTILEKTLITLTTNVDQSSFEKIIDKKDDQKMSKATDNLLNLDFISDKEDSKVNTEIESFDFNFESGADEIKNNDENDVGFIDNSDEKTLSEITIKSFSFDRDFDNNAFDGDFYEDKIESNHPVQHNKTKEEKKPDKPEKE